MGNVTTTITNLYIFVRNRRNISDREFYFSEPQLSGELIIRVVELNDSILLRYLLLRGAPLDVQSYEGNTLLHIAVMNDRKNAFKVLINSRGVNINALNYLLASALTTAAVFNRLYYVKKLVAKGADVNLTDKLGCSPLHYACQYGSAEMCHILIKAGSDVNAQNGLGRTPLHLACQNGMEETIHILLYYGADALIPCASGALPLMMEKFITLSLELKRVLYYHTFDTGISSIHLNTLICAMVIKWPLFPKILDDLSEVMYHKEDLQNLSESLIDIAPEYLELFLKKFPHIIKDMLVSCCTLTRYLTTIENMKYAPPTLLSTMYTFLKSDLAFEIAQNFCVSLSPISSLANIFHKNKLSLSSLTEIVCFLLTYGVTVTPSDLNAIYVFYGRCELFEILLYMDIQTSSDSTPCCSLYDHEVIQQSIMPHFIYDINLNIEKFLENSHNYLLMDLEVLLDYFSHPKLKEFFLDDEEPSERLMKRIQRLPSVPSLVELARDKSRYFIIQRFNVHNSRQFYTVLKRLPINSIYKKIISFEKTLY